MFHDPDGSYPMARLRGDEGMILGASMPTGRAPLSDQEPSLQIRSPAAPMDSRVLEGAVAGHGASCL